MIADFYANGILSLIRLWAEGRLALDEEQMSSCIRILLADMHPQAEKIFALPTE